MQNLNFDVGKWALKRTDMISFSAWQRVQGSRPDVDSEGQEADACVSLSAQVSKLSHGSRLLAPEPAQPAQQMGNTWPHDPDECERMLIACLVQAVRNGDAQAFPDFPYAHFTMKGDCYLLSARS